MTFRLREGEKLPQFASNHRGCSSVVEHFLAKEDVARSNRVTRSIPLSRASMTEGALTNSLDGRVLIRLTRRHEVTKGEKKGLRQSLGRVGLLVEV